MTDGNSTSFARKVMQNFNFAIPEANAEILGVSRGDKVEVRIRNGTASGRFDSFNCTVLDNNRLHIPKDLQGKYNIGDVLEVQVELQVELAMEV